MNFDAIYIVRNNSRESFFYGESAGDYQSAFEALPWLRELAEQHVDMDLTMARLVYHPEDPDCMALHEDDEENGPYVFQAIPRAQAEAMCAPNGAPVSCVITLDFDKGAIQYSPNTKVPVANAMIQKDLDVRMEAGQRCFQKALVDAAKTKEPGRYLDRLNQLLAHRLSALATEWERLRGRTALYTVREAGEEQFFRTDCCGGLVNPIALFLTVEEVLSEVEDLNICLDAGDLMRKMCPSRRTYNVPTSRYGHLMFEALEQDGFRKLLANMDRMEDIAEHVTLDFDENTIAIRRGAWLSNGGGATLCLPFSEAEKWLDRAKLNAGGPVKDYEENVERFLTEKLPAATPEHAQAPASGPVLS